MTAVNPGVSLETTCCVNPPCLIAVVEDSASRVVGSHPPLDEFTTPVQQGQIATEQCPKYPGTDCCRRDDRTWYLRQFAGDTGFDISSGRLCEVFRVGDRRYEGEMCVLHAGENPDDFTAAGGGKSTIPRPFGVVKRRGPWAPNKNWAQERGPHSGRDQVVNFSYSLSEIWLWPAGYKPCFAGSRTRPCAHMYAWTSFCLTGLFLQSI